MHTLIRSVLVILALNLVHAQSDISHLEMVQQLPSAISANFAQEFDTNIKPELISDFTSMIGRYQDDFLNSIYDYLKPVVIVLIVLASAQLALSAVTFMAVIVFGVYMCRVARG